MTDNIKIPYYTCYTCYTYNTYYTYHTYYTLLHLPHLLHLLQLRHLPLTRATTRRLTWCIHPRNALVTTLQLGLHDVWGVTHLWLPSMKYITALVSFAAVFWDVTHAWHPKKTALGIYIGASSPRFWWGSDHLGVAGVQRGGRGEVKFEREVRGEREARSLGSQIATIALRART